MSRKLIEDIKYAGKCLGVMARLPLPIDTVMRPCIPSRGVGVTTVSLGYGLDHRLIADEFDRELVYSIPPLIVRDQSNSSQLLGRVVRARDILSGAFIVPRQKIE